MLTLSDGVLPFPKHLISQTDCAAFLVQLYLHSQ